jgi:uncharacterized protein YqfA (UPF0365 family)
MNFKFYIQAKSNNVPLSLLNFCFFRLQRIDPELMLSCVIRLYKTGIKVEISKIQCHILSGGNIDAVVEAVISANRAKLPFSFEDLCSIDLAGRDILLAVESYINPVMIHCPGNETRERFIVGVAQDGIRLAVQIKITVRADIHKLIGGAGEKTVKARVGEGVIRAIGSQKSHKTLLENPVIISRAIQDSGLLAGTAFELVSVDILEIDIRDNIGAKISSEQSEADTKSAEAFSEAKKAEALATRQEMKAKKKNMQAQLVLSRACLPNAMAEAFNEGNMGVKDCPIKN